MSRRLRLCHVFPGFGPGGSQVRAAKLMSASAGLCSHTVLALDGDLRCADIVAADAELETVAPAAAGPLAAVGLAAALREQRPDLVLTYNWGAMDAVLAARIGGWPAIHHEDGFNPDEADGQKRRRVLARRLLLRAVETVIVPSHALARVARRDWHVAESRLARVANGVDLERFRPGSAAELRRRLGAAPTDIVVGTVGHLNPGKNIAMLLRAVASVADPRVQLMVIGEGPQAEALTALARSLGIDDRVRLLGHVADPAEHFRAMDVFAMTSRTEQMPVSVLEAMASSLPVVATDVGDVRAMVAVAAGDSIVPRDDLAGFVAALRRVVADAGLRRRLGDANRARCESEFGESTMIERHLELWWLAAGVAPEGARALAV